MKSLNLRKRFSKFPWYIQIAVIIGIFLIPTILITTTGYKAIRMQGKAYDKESKAYVDKVVPAIFDDWNTDELYKYTSSEFESVTKKSEAEYVMGVSKKYLGKLKVYQGSQGESLTFINNTDGKKVWGEYVSSVVYEKGRAQILITLTYKDKEWSIYRFRVESPVFEQMQRDQIAE